MGYVAHVSQSGKEGKHQDVSPVPARFHLIAVAFPLMAPLLEINMPLRLRKLIGTFLLVALVILYALIATTVASYRLAESPWWIHLLYFLFTGLLWIVPAMFIIRWMEKPVQSK